MKKVLKKLLVIAPALILLVTIIFILSKQFKVADESSLPKFIKANFVDVSKVVQISKFRSTAGHSNPGWPEACRSMKHYVGVFDSSKKLERNFDRSKAPESDYAIDIYSPVDGRLSKGATGEGDDQLNISVDGYSGYSIRFEHVHLASGIGKMGAKVKAGQKIATAWNEQNFDVSIYYHYIKGDQLFSYFEVLPDNLFAPWITQGLKTKSDVIFTKEYRDAHPGICDSSRRGTPNFIDINGQITENWGGENIINLAGFEKSVADMTSGNILFKADPKINNFTDCAAKYPVFQTNPETCKSEDGRTFTKGIK